MKSVLIIFVLIIESSFVSCSSLLNQVSGKPFKVKRAFYQSWIISDEEKGTDIIVELSGIKKGVAFDSLIFRGVKLKAYSTPVKNGVELKGIIPSGKSRIKMKYEAVNLPDQLIYHDNGERKELLLKNIRREKTRIY